MAVRQSGGSVVFLVDKRNWAFDFIARSIAPRLRPKWRCTVAYADEKPYLDAQRIDILYVFFWGERYYAQYGFAREQIIKEVASYRWMTEERFGRLSSHDFLHRYIDDADIVTTPCASLCELLSPLRPDVYHCPNGIEPSLFSMEKRLTRDLTLIWAGNPNDPAKGLREMILPAIGSAYRLIVADGRHSRLGMRSLYRSADVVLIGSSEESQPLPLIEAMACGCYPVATNVGIVPEIVKDGFNGRILPNRTPHDLRHAVDWCAGHLDHVRAMGEWNAAYIRHYRTWDVVVTRFDEIFSYVMERRHRGAKAARPCAHIEQPSISADTPLRQPTCCGSGARDAAILAPMIVHDWWNSLRMVRKSSCAYAALKRHSRSRDVLSTILRYLGDAIRRAKAKT